MTAEKKEKNVDEISLIHKIAGIFRGILLSAVALLFSRDK